ncbi:MAG: gliding motility-associated C-terminal domain-containing protein [Chryseobacterium sp.]|nr:MAG: gliding motility-associated C-terminal domain-containing protein [Chryseobacterium sp.]
MQQNKINVWWVRMALLLSVVIAAHVGYSQNHSSNDVIKPVARKIMIPTAFTPNNDGHNDVFKMVNITDETLLEMRVFNRWGTVVFATNNISSGWDGKYKGQDQPMAVYGYAIKIRYSDGAEEVYKGTVTLIR